MSLTKKLTGKTNAATSRKLTQPPAGVSGVTDERPWILADGTWNDDGKWIDTENWDDGEE